LPDNRIVSKELSVQKHAAFLAWGFLGMLKKVRNIRFQSGGEWNIYTHPKAGALWGFLAALEGVKSARIFKLKF
jgi:hypothetical protein